MPTVDTIVAYLNAKMEPAAPADAILAYMREHNGKTLTKRDLPKLREIDPSITTYNRAGMAYLSWGGYERTGGREGGSMLLAYTSGAPVIDAAFIEERNACYFAARIERNAARAAALRDPDAIHRLAAALDAMAAAKAEIERLTAHGEPLAQVGLAPFIPRVSYDCD